MNIIPLNDRIIVRCSGHAAGRRTANSVPDSAAAPSEHGTVIAVGTGELDGDGPPVRLAIKAGDTVMFEGDIGDDVTIGGTAYLIMRARDARTIEAIEMISGARRDPRDESRVPLRTLPSR